MHFCLRNKINLWRDIKTLIHNIKVVFKNNTKAFNKINIKSCRYSCHLMLVNGMAKS